MSGRISPAIVLRVHIRNIRRLEVPLLHLLKSLSLGLEHLLHPHHPLHFFAEKIELVAEAHRSSLVSPVPQSLATCARCWNYRGIVVIVFLCIFCSEWKRGGDILAPRKWPGTSTNEALALSQLGTTDIWCRMLLLHVLPTPFIQHPPIQHLQSGSGRACSDWLEHSPLFSWCWTSHWHWARKFKQHAFETRHKKWSSGLPLLYRNITMPLNVMKSNYHRLMLHLIPWHRYII